MCKLNKALYGIKKAPSSWYKKLAQVLIHFIFLHNRSELSLFIYTHQGLNMYALIRVDDILITGSSSILIHKLIDSLHATFSLKKLGKPKYF